jgi:hypothetical protein
MEKWNLLKLFQEWDQGIKENDGGGEFNYDILLRRFVNVTMYLKYHNNKIKNFKKALLHYVIFNFFKVKLSHVYLFAFI